jgi:hypothetical protein
MRGCVELAYDRSRQPSPRREKARADPLPSRAGRGFGERIGTDNKLRYPSPGSGREKGRG